MFGKFVRILGGDPHKREIEGYKETVLQVNDLEAQFEALSDEALRAKTDEFRRRLAEGETLDDLLPEAFAAVREASKRTVEMRPFDTQLIGGMVLHAGRIAEMRTGEGKTLVATLPVYLNALTGRGVHLVTVNDYLARRDARWMAPIYNLLGLNVGVLQMASRTDNGKMAFLVDLEKTSPHEDQNKLRLVPRREAYLADVVYGTNSEFGFDYLRDNLTLSLEDRVQRGHAFAIVDEVDNVLIDEARTPLIISGPSQEDGALYTTAARVVRSLKEEDFEVDEKNRSVALTEIGEAHAEELLGTALRDPERPEDITPEQARMLGHLEQALRAQSLYKRNKDYLVQGGRVIIIDEFTGRLMPGRRWSEGLHQAVEAKENVRIEPANVTYATITLQNYFRMYEKLSGMTGTALTESEEFYKIYKLNVTPIPTNLDYNASLEGSGLEVRETRDEQGYKYQYYVRKGADDPEYFRRKDYPDVVYRSEEVKLRAIVQEIIRCHVLGRPQLVGTTSVEHSERLSGRLQAEPVRRLLQVVLIRHEWMDQHNVEMIERPVEELKPLSRPIPELNTGELRNIARGLGLSLNLEEPANLARLGRALDVPADDQDRLLKVIQGGVPHQVLNARVHDEEARIILRAGQYGAVTIATNMAGRGVDIKLGGTLAPDEDEEAAILDAVNTAVANLGQDPYSLSVDERYRLLKGADLSAYGLKAQERLGRFLEYGRDMERVRALGGLHVIGSERHEARRIDNQLRGRSARQGDPGSSRFYLSLEDDLMRLFGGQQVEGLWKRIMFEENMPLEMNLLGRLVEQSQERVEGANFDVRKHLLEYDDVLNTQRQRIYSERDRVFVKEDLLEDVMDMLRQEIQNRVPLALKDSEGPWRLLAWLDEVQPALAYGPVFMPSFNLRQVIRVLSGRIKESGDLRQPLLDVARRSLELEQEHLLTSAHTLLQRTEEGLENARLERMEGLEAFFDGLRDRAEEGPLKPQELLAEMTELTRTPLRLPADLLRELPEGTDAVQDELRRQVEARLVQATVGRAARTLERRLGEPLALSSGQLQDLDWPAAADLLLGQVENLLQQRTQRLFGEQGAVARDLDAAMARLQPGGYDDRLLLGLLGVMREGTRVAFDERTHRRGSVCVLRLNYTFLAAQELQGLEPEEITRQVLEHLEQAVAALQRIRGLSEWARLAQAQMTLSQLEGFLAGQIAEELGAEAWAGLANRPVAEIPAGPAARVQAVLGRRLQNEAFRQVLLRVISDHWVDYLTQVEALRVSIGLEAYAQRDPLVQYKSRASEMFSQLLSDIRMGVVSRLFTYQPQRGTSAASAGGQAAEEAPASGPQPGAEAGPSGGRGKKKKRRRH